MPSTASTVDLTDVKDDVRSLAEDLRDVAAELGRDLGRLIADLPERLPELSDLPDLDEVRAAVAEKLPAPAAERIAPSRRGPGRKIAVAAILAAVAAGGVVFARSRRRPAPVEPAPAEGAVRSTPVD